MRVVITTCEFNKGFDLYGTNFAHMLSPPRTFSAMEPLIGRCRRMCSHARHFGEDVRRRVVTPVVYVNRASPGAQTLDEARLAVHRKVTFEAQLTKPEGDFHRRRARSRRVPRDRGLCGVDVRGKGRRHVGGRRIDPRVLLPRDGNAAGPGMENHD